MSTQSKPLQSPEVSNKIKSMPHWNVIILNDEEHTVEYVIELLTEIFNHTKENAIRITLQIHHEGHAIVDTTTKERAELKQEQVHSKGRDHRMGKQSTGPLKCEIGPVE